MCLSSFLVLRKDGDRKSVLMGHLNPNAPWEHIGALDPSRVEAHSKGWMLPSSHLIIHESPKEAACRIAREQLGIPDLELSETKIFSEVYTPRRFPNLQSHWDLEFIFMGFIHENQLHRQAAWNDLKFVFPELTPRSDFARSHDEILENLGFKIGM